MADTIQVVTWALGQACKLRQGDACAHPGKALGAIGLAATYSEYLVGRRPGAFGLFGDVCVTGYTSPHLPDRMKGRHDLNYPCGGFLVSDAFKGLGGAAGLVSMCGGCPANTAAPRPAGCAGSLYKRPGSTETQEQLAGILSRLGLEAEFYGVSESEELEKWQFRRLSRPARVFAEWQRQGCRERFGAMFQIPDHLLDACPPSE